MSRVANKSDKSIPLHAIKSQKVQKLPTDACCQKCALCKSNMYESRPIRYAKHYVCRACTKKGYTNREIKILLGVNEENRQCEICHITKTNTEYERDTDNICIECHERIVRHVQQSPPAKVLPSALVNTIPKPPSPTLNPDLYLNNGFIPNDSENMTQTPPLKKTANTDEENKSKNEEDSECSGGSEEEETLAPLADEDLDVEEVQNTSISQQNQQQSPPPSPPHSSSSQQQQQPLNNHNNHQQQQQQQEPPPPPPSPPSIVLPPTSSSLAQSPLSISYQQQQQQQQNQQQQQTQSSSVDINQIQLLEYNLFPFVPRLSLLNPNVIERYLPDLRIPSFRKLKEYNELEIVEGDTIDSYSLKIHNRKESAAIIFEDNIIIPYKCAFESYVKEEEEEEEEEKSDIEIVDVEEEEEENSEKNNNNNNNSNKIYPLQLCRGNSSSSSSSPSSYSSDNHLSNFSLLNYPQTDVSSLLLQRQSLLLSLSSSLSQLSPQLLLSQQQQQQQQNPSVTISPSSSLPQSIEEEEGKEQEQEQQQQQLIGVGNEFDYTEPSADPEIYNEDISFMSYTTDQQEPIIIEDDDEENENENQIYPQVKIENCPTIQTIQQTSLPTLQHSSSSSNHHHQHHHQSPPPEQSSSSSSPSSHEESDDDQSSRLLEAINNLQSILTKKKKPSSSSPVSPSLSSHHSPPPPPPPTKNRSNEEENKDSKDSLSQLQSLLAEITEQIKSKKQNNEEEDLELTQEQEKLIIEIAAKIEKKHSQSSQNSSAKRSASYLQDNENIQPNKMQRLYIQQPYQQQQQPPPPPPPPLAIQPPQQQQPINGIYFTNGEYIPTYQNEILLPEMVEDIYEDPNMNIMNNSNNNNTATTYTYGNYKPILPAPPPSHIPIVPMHIQQQRPILPQPTPPQQHPQQNPASALPQPPPPTQLLPLPLPTYKRVPIPSSSQRVEYNPNYIEQQSLPIPSNDLPILSPERIHQIQQQQRQKQFIIQQQQQQQHQQNQRNSPSRFLDFIPIRKYIPTEYELYQPGIQEQGVIQQFRQPVPPPAPKILPYPINNEFDEESQPVLENQLVISKKKLKPMKTPNKLLASELGRGLFPYPEQGHTLVIKPQQPRAIELLSPNPPPQQIPPPIPPQMSPQMPQQHLQHQSLSPPSHPQIQQQQQQQQQQRQTQSLPLPLVKQTTATNPPPPPPQQQQQHSQIQKTSLPQQQLPKQRILQQQPPPPYPASQLPLIAQQLPFVNKYAGQRNVDVRISRILFKNSVSATVYEFYVSDNKDVIVYTTCPPLICNALRNEDTKMYLMIQQLVLFYNDLSVKVKCKRCSHKVVKRQCFIYDNDFICKACSLKVPSETLRDCPCPERCLCLRCDKCGNNVCYHKFLKFTNDDDIERQSWCSCCRLKEWKDGNVED